MAGEERRLQILRVAVSLISERGFRGTTTREIAQAAGVSEAMVFRHFATKEELYAAILDHKACSGGKFEPAEMAADGIKRKDDRAVFESLALGALDHHEKDPEFQRLLLHSALEKHELAQMFFEDRKSTRLNSSHSQIYTLSLHDALPISRFSITKPAPVESLNRPRWLLTALSAKTIAPSLNRWHSVPSTTTKKIRSFNVSCSTPHSRNTSSRKCFSKIGRAHV